MHHKGRSAARIRGEYILGPWDQVATDVFIPLGSAKTYVYFAQCNGSRGPIKIGTATDVERRIAELAVGNPYGIKLLLAICAPAGIEKELHYHFGWARIRGEWFEATDRLLDLIDRLKERE